MISSYRSRVDAWVMGCLVAGPVVTLAAAIAVTITGDPVGTAVAWGTLLLLAGLYAALVLPIRYELHPAELVVRFGLVRRRVPYDRITEVKPSRSILASPALSLDRIEIRHGPHLPVLISPDDRQRFLLDLQRLTPHLARDGDHLVRR
jgi:hypothetical protein